MKRSLKTILAGLIGAAAIGGGGVAVAQLLQLPLVSNIGTAENVQVLVYGRPSNRYASVLQLRSFVLGQNSQHLTAPTLTGCGGTGAAVNGTDISGQITEGATASTSCVVTFAAPVNTAPECFVSINGVADAALKCAATTTGLTITSTSAASQLVNYQVLGLAGG